MKPSDLVRFVGLAALWGGSFLFMRVAAPEFGPPALMLARCAIGAAVLLTVVLVRGRLRSLLTIWRPMVVLGLVNSALPFVLFGFASLSLASGAVAVLNATTPFWGVLIAWLWLKERLTRWQAAGLCIGFAGVMVLMGGGRSIGAPTGGEAVIAILACLGASFSYGLSAAFTRRFLGNADPLANAAGSQVSATLWLLAPGIGFWPDALPSAGAWWSVILLGVFSTGIAYLLFFRLIADLGVGRAMTVTFAVPLFGIFWGAVILGEAVTVPMVLGGAIVVLGCALTTGAIAPWRRRPATRP